MITSYEQAIEFLYSRINYERVAAGGYSSRDFKLDRMRRFLELIGNPQDRLPVIHVAGTKGKGSTCVMIAEMLTAAGYRVGLFTSPHVTVFEERMTVGGVRPQPAELIDLVNRILDPVLLLDGEPGQMSPTYFEIATALAWMYFADRRAEIAVLEVGLGGRLDATNLCRPEVTVITNISRDHTAVLGSTEAEIAREKAGIIKPGVLVVSGVLHEDARAVIAEIAARNDAPLVQLERDFDYHVIPAADSLEESAANEQLAVCRTRAEIRTSRRSWPSVEVPLAGRHQAANAAVALQAVEELSERGWKVPVDAVPHGLAAVRWPVRIETVAAQPTVIVDGAHNWAAAQALVETLNALRPVRPERRILVFSGTQDKDVAGLLRILLPQFDTIILTQYQSNPRAVDVRRLESLVEGLCEFPVYTASDPAAAWSLAKRLARPEDMICITGSFFIAAEMRELILDERLLETPANPEMRFSNPSGH